MQQLAADVAQLNEQVRRASSSVSDLTDGSLQAVHTTVTYLNANLANLDTSVANLQGFTKEQTEEHGSLSQSISGFASTLHSTGAEVVAASTTDGGPVANAMNDYRHDLLEAGNWVVRENADGGIHAAIAHYAGVVESAGQTVSDATQAYRSDLKSAGQSVVKAGEEGGRSRAHRLPTRQRLWLRARKRRIKCATGSTASFRTTSPRSQRSC